MKVKTRIKKAALALTALLTITFGIGTYLSIQPVPNNLHQHINVTQKNSYLDRYGQRINVTYQNEWNIYDVVKIHQLPEFLQTAFVLSEDQRFFSHHGVDWLARLMALKQNLLAGEIVRGASTISEQVVRMLHPRPRSFWSRWLEGFEAMSLESSHSKLEILEFYLNQVPFKARRRGIVQAADYYFDRDVSTLNQKEMLALAVLVRSPKWLDPESRIASLEQSIDTLLKRLNPAENEQSIIRNQSLVLKTVDTEYDLSHFIAYADANLDAQKLASGLIHTTLDLELQQKVQRLLDSRLNRLQQYQVANAAALIIDHESNEILSWVIGHAGRELKPFNKIDAIRARRQPGSALKPLLYANALRKGWSAATLLDDSPLQEGVGLGMHSYQNYSRQYYGLISLREALGNSLNIPAVKSLQYVGANEFLTLLHDFGINSLSDHPNVYGDGLALGNGELTLYELAQAYTVLARMGDYKPLSITRGEHTTNGSSRVLSEDVASLIGDILSDPAAREKEFGRGSVLNFPQQTAVKTGTSSDYRDAWALGYNNKYTVGIWMGNLNYSPMQEITGSTGPALVLRSIFNELNKQHEVRPLYLSKNLISHRICIETGLTATDGCEARDEWFLPTSGPRRQAALKKPLRIRKPSKGLMLAMDPRIPDDHEYFEFALSEIDNIKTVKWFVNNQLIAVTHKPTYQWKLSKGEFSTRVEVELNDVSELIVTDEVKYRVN